MDVFKLAVIAALAYGGYTYWTERSTQKAVQAAISAAGERRFVSIPTPTGQSEKGVIVFAPPNCPKEAGQRADELMRRLADRGIPSVRSSSANFTFPNPDPVVMAQVQRVMGGELPVVFVNGTGKSNPSFDDVAVQYEATR